MEKNILKKEMMELWKENFHDSDEYIKLIFDHYFEPEFVEYEERDGKLSAALLAIPYIFGTDNNTINSVYLCGLSTRKLYRKQGIMTRLMHKIESRMREKGFSMMFLIPADEGLRQYYSDRGFVNAFYRTELRYTSLHDFERDFRNGIQCKIEAEKTAKIRYFESLKTEIFDSRRPLCDEKKSIIVDYIALFESRKRGFILNQNSEQIDVFLQEAIISGGRICVACAPGGAVAGVVVASLEDEEIRIGGEFAENEAALLKMRSTLNADSSGRGVTILQCGFHLPESRSLWEPYYNGVMPSAGQVGDVGTMERVYDPNQHSKIYGMTRILDVFEILKFVTKGRRDLKYSILAQQENGDKIIEFLAENGNVTKREVSKDSLKRGSQPVMTEKEIAEILFRRPGVEDYLITEAFELPAVNGEIFLMLD